LCTFNKTAGCRVYQQLKMPQEIHADDGKLNLGPQKRPLETAAMENEGQRGLSPQQGMCNPSAPVRGGPDCLLEEEKGKME
jgi:hypothetical protein